MSKHVPLEFSIDQNKNVPINEILCVSPPPYYLDWFERSYPNVPINRDDFPFCLCYMNGVQGGKPARRQCNRPLDIVVTIIKYKKSTIDHDIYIKLFSDVTISYFTVSTDYVMNTHCQYS